MLSADLKLCLVTFPVGGGGEGHVLVENFLHVLEPLTREIYLITGNYPDSAIFSLKIHLRNIKHDSKRQSLLIRIPKYVVTQLRISYNLARVANEIDIVIFFIGGALLLPMLTAKLLRKKTVLVVTGSGFESAEQQYKESPFGRVILPSTLAVLEGLTDRLANRIVVYSPSLVHQSGLQKYKRKISIAHRHFLDFDKFKIQRRLSERENVVGYIGRLSAEKGILNFVRAIPRILEGREEIEFPIAGDGRLQDEIEKYINDESLSSKVKLRGWIPHDEIPGYLNELRLLVLPSYTEGLPNVMLEAMACGTPVLATPVGAVPDVIKDGETGFIMENNSPECIARNVIRVLEHLRFEEIADNAYNLVNREFTYERAVGKYRQILGHLSSGGHYD